jgi:hypothetical protein
MRSVEHWPRSVIEDEGSGSSNPGSADGSLKSSPSLKATNPTSFPSKLRLEESKSSPQSRSRSFAGPASIGNNLLADSIKSSMKPAVSSPPFGPVLVAPRSPSSGVGFNAPFNGAPRSMSVAPVSSALQEARNLTYKHSQYKSSPRLDLGPGPNWSLSPTYSARHSISAASMSSSGFGSVSGQSTQTSTTGRLLSLPGLTVTDDSYSTNINNSLEDIVETDEDINLSRESLSPFSSIRSLKAVPKEIDVDVIFRLESPNVILNNTLKVTEAKLDQLKTLFEESKALVDSYAEDSSSSQAEIEAQLEKLKAVQQELPVENLQDRVAQAKDKVKDYKERLAAVQQHIQLQENDSKTRRLRIVYVKRIGFLVSLFVAIIAIVWAGKLGNTETDEPKPEPLVDPLSDAIYALENLGAEDIISVCAVPS